MSWNPFPSSDGSQCIVVVGHGENSTRVTSFVFSTISSIVDPPWKWFIVYVKLTPSRPSLVSCKSRDTSPIAPLCHARRIFQSRVQDFFTLWKDADPDMPILKQAKAEYAKLR
jgi:hypothetical protein